MGTTVEIEFGYKGWIWMGTTSEIEFEYKWDCRILHQ